MCFVLVTATITILAPWNLTAHDKDRSLLVFAAASLTDALGEANVQYQRDTGHKIVVSYGATSDLAKQIEGGAPADIFVSADLDWMDYVETRKLIKPETRFNLLGNKLVLITSVDSKSI
jgi:molybdate transport system substrate-binding protein